MAAAADVRRVCATRRRRARCTQAAASWRACSRATTVRRRRAACNSSAACPQRVRITRRCQARCMQAAALWRACSRAIMPRRRRVACNRSAACMQCVHAAWRRQTRCMQAAPATRAACVVAACGDAVGEPFSLRRAVGPVHSPCAFRCWHVPCCQMPSVPSGLCRAGNPECSACASCQRLTACSRIGSVANVRRAVRGTCVPVWRRAGPVSICSSRQLGGRVLVVCVPHRQSLMQQPRGVPAQSCL